MFHPDAGSLRSCGPGDTVGLPRVDARRELSRRELGTLGGGRRHAPSQSHAPIPAVRFVFLSYPWKEVFLPRVETTESSLWSPLPGGIAQIPLSGLPDTLLLPLQIVSSFLCTLLELFWLLFGRVLCLEGRWHGSLQCGLHYCVPSVQTPAPPLVTVRSQVSC